MDTDEFENDVVMLKGLYAGMRHISDDALKKNCRHTQEDRDAMFESLFGVTLEIEGKYKNNKDRKIIEKIKNSYGYDGNK